jgi:23S rRNA (cytosine1962-C5)-methyltransferase
LPDAGTTRLRADRRWRRRDRGWTGPALQGGPWPFAKDGLRLELQPTESGQVGLFPEHLAMLPWLHARVARRAPAGGGLAVLHLFAYTGLATLALAAAGAAVGHVDASKPTVAWARRNAELSGLSDRPIRWIVDDAAGFTEREARRNRRFAGIVLDPPSYGHGPAARPWRLEADLPHLLAACDRVIEPDGFVLLTAHTPGFEAERLARLLERGFTSIHGDVEHGDLTVTAPDGQVLELGAFARRDGGAS